ncbi:MAG: substrate-binding domain-containing protein [Acidobacteria bacterium]|nr:substrate-binding domain-containing protein [Acidobacteriota bacterium]
MRVVTTGRKRVPRAPARRLSARVRAVLPAAGLVAALALGLGGCGGQAPAVRVVRLATTTSTENSGLLAWLLPKFEKDTGIRVDVIAVGSGKAMALGRTGDVDVILAHSREDEERFMREGYGRYRLDVMYNDFVLVGPPADPAGVRGTRAASAAFKAIAAAGSPFVSRGDESGTHQAERKFWEDAGVTPGGPWYAEAGQAMGAVLLMASNQQAYALTDRATYLKMKPKLELEILLEGDPAMFNPYGVIPVRLAKFGRPEKPEAEILARWLVSPAGQTAIAEFGVAACGKPLFFPNAPGTGR